MNLVIVINVVFYFNKMKYKYPKYVHGSEEANPLGIKLFFWDVFPFEWVINYCAGDKYLKEKISQKNILSHLNRSSIMGQLTD